MKKIVLVRHADAISRKAGLPDRERSLLRGGVRDARAAARQLRRRGVVPDLIVSSPANRALETAHLLAEGLDYPLESVRIEPALYEREEATALLEIIKKTPPESEIVIFCGHDPQFSAAAELLAAGFTEKLAKGAALGLVVAASGWGDVGPGAGRPFLFHTPLTRTERKRLLAAAREGLVGRLAAGLEAELAGIDPRAASEVHRAALEAAARLVDRFLKRAHKRDLLLHHRLRARPADDGPGGADATADRPEPKGDEAHDGS